MAIKKRKIRTRYYVAVEGESEQSFIKWIQQLCDQSELYVHLDCKPLEGGGYETMLTNAIFYQKQRDVRANTKAKFSILIVDGDRASRQDENWTIKELKERALKKGIHVYVQEPNLEGIFLKMLPGKRKAQTSLNELQNLLRATWPKYKKPVDAQTLASKFSIEDLFIAANTDSDLNNFLDLIGLKIQQKK